MKEKQVESFLQSSVMFSQMLNHDKFGELMAKSLSSLSASKEFHEMVSQVAQKFLLPTEPKQLTSYFDLKPAGNKAEEEEKEKKGKHPTVDEKSQLSSSFLQPKEQLKEKMGKKEEKERKEEEKKEEEKKEGKKEKKEGKKEKEGKEEKKEKKEGNEEKKEEKEGKKDPKSTSAPEKEKVEKPQKEDAPLNPNTSQKEDAPLNPNTSQGDQLSDFLMIDN